MSKLTPPFAVFTNLSRAGELQGIQRAVAEHFPGAAWQSSDVHKPCNVRYSYVPLRTNALVAPPAAGSQ